MEQWRKDARSEAIIVDLEALVPQDHLLRKIEKEMDYESCLQILDTENTGDKVAMSTLSYL